VSGVLSERELTAAFRFVKKIHKSKAVIQKAEKVDARLSSQAGSWMEISR
jgi:carbamate kinase